MVGIGLCICLGTLSSQTKKANDLYFLKVQCCQLNTIGKIHDVSVTQILREINIGNSILLSAKYAILTHLEALNFDFFALFDF